MSVTLETFKTKVCWHDFELDIDNKTKNFMVDKINVFAQKMKESHQYYTTERNASSPIKDDKIGKYGEFAVALALKLGIITTEKFPTLMPDITVRNRWEKGWDCDLPFSQKDSRFPDCHVKALEQDTSEFLISRGNDPYSWTFQYRNNSGRGGRDKLFATPDSNELVLFMFVPFFGSSKVKLIASAPWSKLQTIIKDPLARKLIGLKKCIYSKDLFMLAKEEKAINLYS